MLIESPSSRACGRHYFLGILLLLATEQTPQTPAFKSNVTIVEVDAVVTDKSQQPVRGLSREDFQVFENDRPVGIATFSEVHIPGTPASPIPPLNRSGSAFASNEQPHDGRLILIVLDDVLSGFTAARMSTMKSVARRAVERLGPTDIAGIVTTSGPSRSASRRGIVRGRR